MIIDSSAIIAIVFREPEAVRLATAIAKAPLRHMSCVNWLETMMAVEGRFGQAAVDEVLLILSQFAVETLPFDTAHMYEAQEAWRRFGKGRHPAALNMGDCCAYAASMLEGRPLLFKGDDFGQTDVQKAPW